MSLLIPTKFDLKPAIAQKTVFFTNQIIVLPIYSVIYVLYMTKSEK